VSWTIESVREADLDPGAVFALYADPSTWSSWGHNATWARADGPLVQGGTVDVRANYRTVYHCLIRRLEPGRALELVVRPALMTIVNIYEVEPTAHGARIRHAFEVSGPIASVTRLIGLDRMYQRQLNEEVAAVIRIAANPGAVPDERPVSQVSLPERIWHRMGRLFRGGREPQ
jgi:Polyketide cyclase / dehydrase and lipid transport